MKKSKYTWDKAYTAILIANIVYVVLFYLITEKYTF
jgi:hypothetical protein